MILLQKSLPVRNFMWLCVIFVILENDFYVVTRDSTSRYVPLFFCKTPRTSEVVFETALLKVLIHVTLIYEVGFGAPSESVAGYRTRRARQAWGNGRCEPDLPTSNA